MKIIEAFRDDQSRVLDRLVDGELTAAERRELLALLDDEPAGWRRCALAFLEAQSLSESLRAIAGEAHASAEPRPVFTNSLSEVSPRVELEKPSPSRSISWGWSLAVAAALLVAFGLGNRLGNRGTAPEIAGVQTASEPRTAALPTAEVAQRPETTQAADETVNAESDDPRLVAQADENTPGEDDLGTLVLEFDADSEDQRKIALPLKSGQNAADAFSEESPISAELLSAFEQAGVKFTRQRQLWPVELSDGRQVIVPVDQLEIQGTSQVY